MEKTARAVDGTLEALMEAINDIPALLLHDVPDTVDDVETVITGFPLVVLPYALAHIIALFRNGLGLQERCPRKSACFQRRY